MENNGGTPILEYARETLAAMDAIDKAAGGTVPGDLVLSEWLRTAAFAFRAALDLAKDEQVALCLAEGLITLEAIWRVLRAGEERTGEGLVCIHGLPVSYPASTAEEVPPWS